MINPALAAYPEEARLLGEMVLGYGELELSFALMVGQVINQKFPLLNAVNQVRTETGRIEIANAMGVATFQDLGLNAEYERTVRALRWCLKARNQYAHAQWGDMDFHGLAFTPIDGNTFREPIKPTDWKSLTLPLLRKQEAFFEYTRKCLLTLTNIGVAAAHDRARQLDMPPEMHAPSLHSQWGPRVPPNIRRAR